MSSNLRNQRQRRHAGLGVDFEQIERAGLALCVVVTEVSATDAAAAKGRMGPGSDIKCCVICLGMDWGRHQVLGLAVGDVDGRDDGDALGFEDGLVDGFEDGLADGFALGLVVGPPVGLWVGLVDGLPVGESEGIFVGDTLGFEDGVVDGFAVGLVDGR